MSLPSSRGLCVLALCVFGCGSEFSGDSGGKGGGTGGDTEAGAGGEGANAGEAGTASGGSSGASGTGGNSGGSAGASGSGGSSGAGASSGSGGSSGSAGQIGVLGDTCSPRGKLACAGNHQKLTLLCGPSGTWEANDTCSGDQFCDSRADVPSTGTCQDPDPNCVDREPGYRFCKGTTSVYACDADTVSTVEVEMCDGICSEGACDNETDACPTEPVFTNCATDCGGLLKCGFSSTDGCAQANIAIPTSGRGVVRTSEAMATCRSCQGTQPMVIVAPGTGLYRVTVEPPWSLVPPPVPADACMIGKQCIINGYSNVSGYSAFVAIASDTSAPIRNILIEEVPADVEGCP
jgi:hypothetical protein